MNTDNTFQAALLDWMLSDNEHCHSYNNYTTQCSQYRKIFTESELSDYFYKEYYKVDGRHE